MHSTPREPTHEKSCAGQPGGLTAAVTCPTAEPHFAELQVLRSVQRRRTTAESMYAWDHVPVRTSHIFMIASSLAGCVHGAAVTNSVVPGRMGHQQCGGDVGCSTDNCHSHGPAACHSPHGWAAQLAWSMEGPNFYPAVAGTHPECSHCTPGPLPQLAGTTLQYFLRHRSCQMLHILQLEEGS